jgi:hypothetical protein
METVQEQELELHTQCQEMEQKSMELDHKSLETGNDSDRIALKDKLVDTYEKYKAKKYTKEQMLCLVPQLKEVIDAFEVQEHE